MNHVSLKNPNFILQKPEPKPDARVQNPKRPKCQIYPNTKYKKLLQRYMQDKGYDSESSAAFSILRATLDRMYPNG